MQPGANSKGLIAVDVLALVLGTLAVALRLYTRKVLLKQLWLDDYLAFGSWLCLVGLVAQNFHNISTGLGSHFVDIPPAVVPKFYLDTWLGLVIYQVALLFTKFTLFFQFYRIIRNTSWQRQKISYTVIMAIIASWQIGQLFLQIFACLPVAKSWDMTLKGTCQSVNTMRAMNSIANVVSDFIILLLPLPIIWRLSLPLRQRLALGAIFCLGFLTCIISILRFTLTAVASQSFDISWDTVNVIAWTTAEVMTGIIIAALSTLRPLIGRYSKGWTTRKGSTARTGASGPGGGYQLKDLSSGNTSHTDRRSTFIAAPRRLSGGGWLDLEGSDSGDMAGKYGGASLMDPRLARLVPRTVRVPGSIHVTRQWSVEETESSRGAFHV